jgi:type IV secretion system protein VirB4
MAKGTLTPLARSLQLMAGPTGVAIMNLLHGIRGSSPTRAFSLEQRRANGVIGPTLVMLPEIWNLLDDESFARQIGNWIVTMRKKLGCVWMDAQSPEQVSSSAIWPQIRDNVLVRVFVPVENFTPSAKTAYQRDFGLSDGQIRTIQKLVAKRDYFIAEQGDASRRISVPLDPRTIAILRSEMSAQIMFDRHLHSGLPDWKERYIEEATAQARGDPVPAVAPDAHPEVDHA